MSKIMSFSFPENWNCLDSVLEKLPRSVNQSGAVRLAVEDYQKKLDQTPYLSLDEFSENKVVPRLDLPRKQWDVLFKGMNLVKTEIFERTL